MDYKVIINLMKEMNQMDLTKVEIESEGVRICMEKDRPLKGKEVEKQLESAEEGCIPDQASQAPAAGIMVEPAADKCGYKKLLSPMVGTFYAQPSPEKPPFVGVGDMVKKGQTICIIEAMKLMNEIESEYDGEIVEVLVENDDMVEFGQPLFLIK